ncbi:SRPBCC family protein [Oceanobacillus massiliensis]|uniref:SRPBCC family protein n=1 Tax=Oceanobacillus massiliensis TaxID=1465765 RepID=UPI0030164E5E
MIQFSNSLMIDTASSHVFAFLEEIENYTKWNYAVKQIVPITANGNRQDGATYRLYREVLGRQAYEEITFLERIPNQKLSMEAIGKFFHYTMIYEISTMGENQTLLVNNATLHATGVGSIFFRLFQRNIKKEVFQNLHVLKHILEENKSDRS